MGEPRSREALALALLEASPDAMLLTDDEGKLVLVSKQAEELFGYRREELLGQPIEILVPVARRPAHVKEREGYQRAPRTRAMGAALSLSALRKDGTEIAVEVSLSPVPTPEGTLVAAAVRDVSARRRTEESLKEAEERFRLAFDQAPIGMALVGLDGRFLRVNEELCRLVGYSADELVALTFQEITHPDDLDADLAFAEKLERGNIRNYRLGKRYLRKDGAIVHVVLTGSVVRDDAGKALHYVAHVEDVTDRVAIEDELRRSRAKFWDLIEQAPDPIFIADLEGHYVEVNSAACAMLGYTRDELLGKRITDLIPPADVPRLAMEKEALLVPGTVHFGEWSLRRKDGTSVPVEVSSKILDDGRWQAFIRDISERRAGEATKRRLLERNREQTRFLDAVVDTLPALLFIKNSADLTYERINRAFEDTIGCSREDVVGQDDHALFGLEEARAFRKKDREVLDAGKRVDIEEETAQSRTGPRWFKTMKVPLFDDSGVPKHLLGVSIDITARKEAERERDANLRWLAAVLHQSPIAMMIAQGSEGEHVTLNDAARRLFGIEGDVVTPYEGFLSTPAGGALPVSETPFRRALKGEKTENAEFLLHRPDGGIVTIVLGVTPVRDSDGTVIGAAAIAYDVTPVKKLEQVRGEWSSVVAHDLRQPLSTILLQIRMLAMQNAGIAELRAPIERIQRSVARLDRMISDLLDLSRLEAERFTLSRTQVDLAALVQSCLDDATLQAPDRPLSLEVRDAIPPVSCDPNRMSQIVHNLLSNAIKYGTPKSPIVATITMRDGEVSVAVTNEGPGIAREDIPRLFERFRRTESARLAGIEGFGLGLFITRALVEAHGGRIDVESTPGGTTTFCVKIPLDGAPHSRSPSELTMH